MLSMELNCLTEVAVRCNSLGEEILVKVPPLLLVPEGNTPTIDLEGPLRCEGSSGETIVPVKEVKNPERSGRSRPVVLRPDPETKVRRLEGGLLAAVALAEAVRRTRSRSLLWSDRPDCS
jgi:hypothetical protein